MGESPALADHERFARVLLSYAFLVVADDEPKRTLPQWQDPVGPVAEVVWRGVRRRPRACQSRPWCRAMVSSERPRKRAALS